MRTIWLRVKWFARNNFWWNGYIAIGDGKVQARLHDRGIAMAASQNRTKLDKCRVCGVQILGWRRITLCKQFSCYVETVS